MRSPSISKRRHGPACARSRKPRASFASVNRPNGRVLVDTIHVDRSGGSAAEIASMPPTLIAYAQICDAHGPRPADFETMIFQARNERAFPGEGNLDLAGMLRALPPGIPLESRMPDQ